MDKQKIQQIVEEMTFGWAFPMYAPLGSII